MNRLHQSISGIIIALLMTSSGCLGFVPIGETPSSNSADDSPNSPAYRTATTTPEPLTGQTNCSEANGVSLWGLDDPTLWSPDEIRFSGYVPPNTSYLFVAYVDGTVHGVRVASNNGNSDGINIDGAPIGLDRAFTGEHTVRVVVYRDVDRDGELDLDTEAPCYNEYGLVQTEYYVVNFSRLSTATTEG